MKKIIIFYLISLFSFDSELFANMPSHMFNSNLLEPGQKQISIAGNFKLGINEDFELGTQALFSASGVYNLSLRHRMFHGDSFQTSFSYHGFIASQEASVSKIGFWSINHSYKYSISSTYSLGLFKIFYDESKDLFSNLELEVDFYLSSFSYDYLLSNNNYITGLVVLPIFVSSDFNSDTVNASVDNFLFPGFNSFIGPTYLASITFAKSHVNYELGYFGMLGSSGLYLNVFWQWI